MLKNQTQHENIGHASSDRVTFPLLPLAPQPDPSSAHHSHPFFDKYSAASFFPPPGLLMALPGAGRVSHLCPKPSKVAKERSPGEAARAPCGPLVPQLCPTVSPKSPGRAQAVPGAAFGALKPWQDVHKDPKCSRARGDTAVPSAGVGIQGGL